MVYDQEATEECCTIHHCLLTIFSQIDTKATIYFITWIGAAFIQEWLLIEGGAYFFEHITLARQFPRSHVALIIVLPLCTDTRQHAILMHAHINGHTQVQI